MQTDSWLESFGAVHAQAVKLSGARNVFLCMNEGKLYDTPDWSGQRLAELAASDGGCAVLKSILDSLERGDAVPIELMDRHVSTGLPKLQVIDGQLYEIWPEGRRLAVNGYRD